MRKIPSLFGDKHRDIKDSHHLTVDFLFSQTEISAGSICIYTFRELIVNGSGINKHKDSQETATYNLDRASSRRVWDKARGASGEVRGLWHQSGWS